MSTTTEQRSDISGDSCNTNGIQSSQCLYCRKCPSNPSSAPYCSVNCAVEGCKKRYKFLKIFVDFESKYINPPTKTITEKTETKEDENNEKEEEVKQKKPKK